MDAYSIGYVIGVLIGLYGYYAIGHVFIVSLYKSYKDRSKYEKAITWIAGAWFVICILIEMFS